MGGTYWSDDHYRERAAFLRRAGRGAFEYHDLNMRLPERERRVHEKMNPYGVQCRESRDSEAHPESRAVAVLFDVTGSMGRVPRILQENLCQLMGLLLRQGLSGPSADPHRRHRRRHLRPRPAASRPVRVGHRDRRRPRQALAGRGRRRAADRVLRAGHVLHGPQDRDRLPGEARPAGIPVPDRRRDALPLVQAGRKWRACSATAWKRTSPSKRWSASWKRSTTPTSSFPT